MSEFTVRGRFQTREGYQQFERTTTAENEAVAIEHTYADFGSEHGLKRTQVDIEGVSQ
ncbi:50S ribosomal protein L18Ae [Halocatena pleomorpha]|uniref:Large ribosomal subunit protein eL20 n=1 Tax=Halocatena pleomorpha TaxID=1785090 RepID=A0A3P3RC28_9EURY|nr:50S ribosomal protein L18Ae [Halocatena pleomorpha]RRJ31026.1 50S ribosomal protein L18a [Halocatena pleomorpha]